MRWLRRKETQQTPCPQCSKLLSIDADECDLCGAELQEFSARHLIPTNDAAAPRRGY